MDAMDASDLDAYRALLQTLTDRELDMRALATLHGMMTKDDPRARERYGAIQDERARRRVRRLAD